MPLHRARRRPATRRQSASSCPPMSSSTRPRSASIPISLGALEVERSCWCIADGVGRAPTASSASATRMTRTSSC
eukprot:4875544-Lingulodinium_polyedra.AAC.1